ncbi:uncharacterized protein FIBRA_05457 [Fibroporia radiculosa]|uniref:SET domain-containing protein n=1 Tax=Fibroporia radiculosa TaxID=599839 RepID=J4H3I4_9APHY|nr:uncharacterized protein FIBRA_05457 [Fibroporia radiculosa]CCM03329.1 predicted protein [Fibroporia radiculosa]
MPQAATSSSSSLHPAWRPTKIMNMRDLSRDDDFLSHLLVEKLGTGAVPLVVHKMDASRIIPKANPDDLLQTVRRLVAAKGPPQTAIREAVDELLTLDAVRYYVKNYDQKQLNAFATHASRYFELYLPTGSIEIAHTSRYTHKTGKSELCILATRPLMPGMVITELKGSMADLTEEEDMELKRIDGSCVDGAQIRRDFSVIHSKQLKKNHLFLGPARFVNHDCDHNVELFREGRYITFRVIKPIAVGDEVTAHYGDGYFGRKNRHCLCESCERLGKGGYAPNASEDELSDSGPGSPPQVPAEKGNGNIDSSDSDESDSEAAVNVNERRTRRGVYAVVDNIGKDADLGGGGQIELEAEVEPDTASDLTSLPPSRSSVPLAGPSKGNGMMTPDSDLAPVQDWLRGVDSPLSVESTSINERTTSSAVSTPTRFRSVISTRAQRAREEATSGELESISSRGTSGRGRGGRGGKSGRSSADPARQLVTPPLTADRSDSTGPSVRSSSRMRTRAGDQDRTLSRFATPLQDKTDVASTSDMMDRKGKAREEPEREARTLRPRMIHPALAEQQGVSTKKPEEDPRDVDGKPLPTCVTCKNVLPVIHMEGQPIWGHGFGRTGKRGRPRKHFSVECPRCMRHFEIYALKWPERLPGDGSSAFLPTPRDTRNSTPITHSALATLDRKLAFAMHGYAPPKRPYKRRREADGIDVERPTKKQKPSTGRPRGRPRKNKVGMSAKAMEILQVPEHKAAAKASPESGRRSSRTRMPTLKLRESEPPKPRMQSISRPPASTSSLSTACSEDEIVLPGTPPREVAEIEESPKLPTPKSLAVAAQPRDSNGRFGKKSNTNGRYMRKSFTIGGRRRARAHRPVIKVRSRVEPKEGDSEVERGEIFSLPTPIVKVESSGSTSQKRPLEEVGRASTKKICLDGDEDSDADHGDLSPLSDSADSSEETEYRRPSLLSTGMKHGASLLCAPNPMTFARRKWAPAPADTSSRTSTVADGIHSSTEDDTDLPVTPEDDGNLEYLGVKELDQRFGFGQDATQDAGHSALAPSPSLPPSSYVGKLTLKPSPINLARRRWAPPPPTKLRNSPTIAESADQEILVTDSQDEFDYDLDSYYTSSDEEGDLLNRSRLSHPLADPSDRPTRRRSSIPSVDSSAGDTEQVERLVDESPSITSDRSEVSRPRSVLSSYSSDKSPGMAWKKTVLLPTSNPYLTNPKASFVTNFPSSPVKLMRAGWDTASDSDSCQ